MTETGIDLSQAGTYTLDAHLVPNGVNTLDVNDTLESVDEEVQEEFKITPKTTNLPSALDSVEICVESSFLGAGEFIITEVSSLCRFWNRSAVLSRLT
ncbi:MAG: hypothetical protein U5L96_02960 [Owenweeksia sp.]|nr:hypothetical protein [Owenweeksia sp.]